MTTIFLNGRFLSREEARVSAFDAGLQHGVGLFETMLGGCAGEPPKRPWVFRLEEHLERLIASASQLGLSDSLRAPALAQAVLATVERAALPMTRVRLTITGGDLNLLDRRGAMLGERPGTATSAATSPANGSIDSTVLIVAQPASEYPSEMLDRGVSLVVAGLKSNPLDPLAGHKTLNYWARLRELQIAARARAGEALVMQVTNFLAGGCVSNAFLVKDGRLITPIARGEEFGAEASFGAAHARAASAPMPTPSPVLPGVTRGWVLEWARQHQLRFERRMVSISDVLDADELFLTNSSWGVLPCVRVEQKQIASGVPGEVTRKLLAAWPLAIDAASESA